MHFFAGNRPIFNESLKTPCFWQGVENDLNLGLLFDVFLEHTIPVGMA